MLRSTSRNGSAARRASKWCYEAIDALRTTAGFAHRPITTGKPRAKRRSLPLHHHRHIPIAGVAHQAGTCRFGTDPRTSVLDVNCKVHELDNLYVVDTSFFPSIGAVNPRRSRNRLGRWGTKRSGWMPT